MRMSDDGTTSCHRGPPQGRSCGGLTRVCVLSQAHGVPNLVDNDKIVTTVTYSVAGHVVSQKVYV